MIWTLVSDVKRLMDQNKIRKKKLRIYLRSGEKCDARLISDPEHNRKQSCSSPCIQVALMRGSTDVMIYDKPQQQAADFKFMLH